MAAHRRSITACGAGRSGSPIERLMTSIPAALRSAIFFFASAKWYGGRLLIRLDSCTMVAPFYILLHRLRLIPILPNFQLNPDRHVQVCYTFHDALDQAFGSFKLFNWHLEDAFVM